MFDESIQLSGQHIVSMLSDKLEEQDYKKYKNYIILELSQDNKFFNIWSKGCQLGGLLVAIL